LGLELKQQSAIFEYFTTVFEMVVHSERKEGALDEV
jgi:hypothetical protein